MRHNYYTFLLTLLMSLIELKAYSHDIEVENAERRTIYYNWIYNKTALSVTFRGDKPTSYSNEYSGNVVIPSKVTYQGQSYRVVSIGSSAFSSCQLTSITIPESVSSIEEQAFYSCRKLTSVIIPNSVTSIENSVFSACDGLTSVTIPNSVTSIGRAAFASCRSLTSINIPENVTSIGFNAFRYCSSLTSIYIPESVTSIGFDAFSDTPWFNNQPDGMVYAGKVAYKYKGTMPDNTEMLIKEGTESVSSYAFSGCSGLASITIPSSLTSIGSDAFKECNNLTSVTINSNSLISQGFSVRDIFGAQVREYIIGNQVTSIGYYAFSGCDEMKSVTISESVNTIRRYAFNGCVGLTSVTIPDGMTKIEDCAFPNCTGLMSVVIGKDVTELSYSAFVGCSGIKSVTINSDYWVSKASHSFKEIFGSHVEELTLGNQVTSIRASVFSGCSGLKSVTIPESVKSIGDNAFYDCKSLPSVTIPNSVTDIGKSAFQYCSALSTVTIGNSVVTIGESAFKACVTLTSVIMKKESPVIIASGTFYNPQNVTLYVPRGSKSAYKALDVWKDFKDIVELSDSDIPIRSLIYVVDGVEYKIYEIEEGATTIIEPVPQKEGYTFSGWSEIPETMPAHDVIVTGTFIVNSYKLTYEVDGVEYKTFTIDYGAAITPEPAPIKEGHSFSGWSEIPATMPANDVVVTGSFSINSYTLTYKVDGEEYKSFTVVYGTAITPEAEPTKEGYTFSGWSEIPETMPSHDVEVTGTFSINSYTLIYKVDGEEYKSFAVVYGTAITPEAEPTKEGYTFSGWSEIPATMPAHDVEVNGSFTINSYTLTYMVDGEEYKTLTVVYGTAITPEAEPKKEGHTFNGWSEIPATMPAHDVVVTGIFTVNYYILTYIVDGEVYKTLTIAYDTVITPEAQPVKIGYTFSGWSNIPATMPAHDITITGSYTINSYKLTYVVDGVEYKTLTVVYGTVITPEPVPPTKEGYTFSGWSEIPVTMPAYDVTVTGTFTVNEYTLTYIIDKEVYKIRIVAYGTVITPEQEPMNEGYTFSGWSEIPATMPAHDVVVTGSFIVNQYMLTYIIDGEEYRSYTVDYKTAITPEPAPIRKGMTFSGWGEIPATMPAHDVTLTGIYSWMRETFDDVIYQVADTLNNYASVVGNENEIEDAEILPCVEIGGYIYTVNSIGDSAFYGCTNMTTLKLFEGLEIIGASAFEGCSELITFTIPVSVKRIGAKAFYGCMNAKIVNSPNPIPPICAKDAFEGGTQYAKLYVPTGAIDDYYIAPGWSKFYNIQEKEFEDGIHELFRSKDAIVDRFDLNGRKLAEPQKGINIIRYSDGTSRKVLVK